LLAVLAGACASLTADLPPISSEATGERHPGKIIWRDLLTNDPDASKAFYAGLFGWEFENLGGAAGLSSDSAYSLIRHNGELIGGMFDTVALNGRTDISQWIVPMSVDDIDSAVARARAAGGALIAGPRDFSRRGTIALASDAEGAIIGLLRTRDDDPADRPPAYGEFLWSERAATG
jgi:predicted enzyme related to lactoylglutathione lyase